MYNYILHYRRFTTMTFSMKDYENFLKEEERQDRLQAKFEDKLELESYGSEDDWQAWQEKQKAEADWKAWQESHRACEADIETLESLRKFDYEDDDCYSPECEDDCEDDDSSLEDLYDMYSEPTEDSCYPDPEAEDLYGDELFFDEHSLKEKTPEELRIIKKSIARNRHLRKLRAARAAKKISEFTTSRGIREMREDVKKSSKLEKKLSQLENELFSNPSNMSSIKKEITKTFKELDEVYRRIDLQKKVLEKQNKKRA